MNDSMNYFNKLNFEYEGQKNTLFIVDTNYFLYAYQSYSLSNKYVEALKNQNIYIPFIVFIEFINNIDDIKQETSKALKNTDAQIEKINIDDVFTKEDIKNQLRSKLFNTKQLNNNRGIRFQEEVEQEITNLIQTISNKIHDNINDINELIKTDAQNFKQKNKKRFDYEKYENNLNLLNEEFNKIFNEGLGKKYTLDEILEFTKDMDERFLNKIPPGFKDADKTTGSSKSPRMTRYGDLEFESQAGDLILWKDVIQHVNDAEDEFDHVVIVTDDAKEDWKSSKGSEKVNKALKIEFLEKTERSLDVISVQNFINRSEIDEVSKSLINKELENKKIIFTFNRQKHGTDTQAEMMKYIFERVINEYPTKTDDLLTLPCLTTSKELKDKTSATFDSTHVLDVEIEKELILGTRLNIQDKLTYISQLFIKSDINLENLSFETPKMNYIWENIKRK